MKTFNENDFLLDLEDSIASENPEDVWEMIHQTIDTECIYYSNCFDIVKTLNYKSWEDMNDYTANLYSHSKMIIDALFNLVAF